MNTPRLLLAAALTAVVLPIHAQQVGGEPAWPTALPLAEGFVGEANTVRLKIE